MLPEQSMWFPMPPAVQHPKKEAASQPGTLSESAAGNKALDDPREPETEAEKEWKRGSRQAVVGDPFSGSVLGGAAMEKKERGEVAGETEEDMM